MSDRYHAVQCVGDPTKVHYTVQEILDCTACYPAYEKVLLSRIRQLELELEAENRLTELKKRLGLEALKLQGKRPSGLKAGMCYIIAKERGLDLTQDELADIYGCSWVVVHQNVKLLKQLMQDNGVKLECLGKP